MGNPQYTSNAIDSVDLKLLNIGIEQLEAGEYREAIDTLLDLQNRYPDNPEIATRLREAECLARFRFLRPLVLLGSGWVCRSPVNSTVTAVISLVVLMGVITLAYRVIVTPSGTEPPAPSPSGITGSPVTIAIATTESPELPAVSTKAITEVTEPSTEAPPTEVTEPPTQEVIETRAETEEPPPITLPAAPANVKVLGSTDISIALTWSNPDGQTKIVVKRNGNLIAELPADSQSYTDNGLACGSSYSYTIVAANEAGQSESAPITAQTEKCPPPPSSPPTPAGKIAVPVFENGAYNIYIARASDSWQPKLFFQNGSQPAFSPDGRQIILRSWRQASQGFGQRLVLLPSLRTDAGDERLMTYNLEDAHPSLSRSGEIVFHTRREGAPILVTLGTWVGAESDRDNQVKLGLGENPDWLGDNRIVYYAPGPPSGLYVMNKDGSNVQLVLSEEGSVTPAAVPDGDHVAVSLQRAGRWHVFTFLVSQGENGLIQLTNEDADDQLPVWSPDGNFIAFVSNRGGTWAAWVMNADGTSQRKLFDLSGPIDGEVSIAPDMSYGWGEEKLSWAP
jgi:hypothetical protein